MVYSRPYKDILNFIGKVGTTGTATERLIKESNKHEEQENEDFLKLFLKFI